MPPTPRLATVKDSVFDRRHVLKTAGFGAAASFFATACSKVAKVSKVAKPSDRVRGVVFMVSDGMSPGVLTLAQAFSQLTRQRGCEWWKLNNAKQVTRGLMDTASANSLVTDSAAASSAWGGGQRVNNGSINFTPAGKPVEPIAALLKRKCRANIGLVTTATVTHATPAGFAASEMQRDDEAQIAAQYLDRADVVLGGGAEFFDKAERLDQRDLRGDFAKAGYSCLGNRGELLAARGARLLGTFSAAHLPFSLDRSHDPALASAVPTLAEMATAALQRFLGDAKPFLLQVEGARIDHAAHLNDCGALLADQLAFDDALGTILPMLAKHPDVLLVVTSDHGNANPGLNGMGASYSESSACFSRIAKCTGTYAKIFTELAAGPEPTPQTLTELVQKYLSVRLREDEAGALSSALRAGEVTEWNRQLVTPGGLLGQMVGNHTGIGWTGTTHTSDPTLVTACGPQAERFGGMVKNSDVFGHLVELLA